MEHRQKEALSLMREILQEDLLQFEVESYKLEESFKHEKCSIYLSFRDIGSKELFSTEGSGVGMLDAVFKALKARLAPDYPSLNSITFSSFNVKGLMSSGHDAKSDAEALVQMGVRNSYDNEFTFESTSRSIGRCMIEATMSAIQYFVNSERAFVRMYKARNHYEKEGRSELVAKYTSLMSRMVENTSYSEVLDRIKAEIA